MRGVLVIIIATAMASDGWDTLWWLPSDGEVTPGKQVASHKTMPHLMFIPAGTPPTDGPRFVARARTLDEYAEPPAVVTNDACDILGESVGASPINTCDEWRQARGAPPLASAPAAACASPAHSSRARALAAERRVPGRDCRRGADGDGAARAAGAARLGRRAHR